MYTEVTLIIIYKNIAVNILEISDYFNLVVHSAATLSCIEAKTLTAITHCLVGIIIILWCVGGDSVPSACHFSQPSH